MPSLESCLKKVTGLSRDDRITVNQIAKLHRKAGMSPAEADAKAVSDVLDTVRGDYNVLEAEVAGQGGYIDPFRTLEEKYSPAPEVDDVDAGADIREFDKDVGLDPEDTDTASFPDALSEYSLKRGTFNRAIEFLNDSDVEPAELAWAVTPDQDGKVGIKQIRQAVKKIQADRDAGTDVDVSGLVNPEDADAALDLAIQQRRELFEAIGDFSPESQLKYVTDLENLVGVHQAMRTRTGGGELSSGTGDVIKKMISGLDASDQKIVSSLRYTLKKKGMTNREAEAQALMKFMSMNIERNLKDTIAAEDAQAGLRRERSATGRAMDELETGSTQAGIGNAGLQGILKQTGEPRVNKKLAGQQTVPNEAVKTTGAIAREVAEGKPVEGLETAMALSQSPRTMPDGRMGKSTMPIKYISQERVKTADSSMLNSGDEGWYDPITNKSYKNEDYMRMARGEKPLPKAHSTAEAAPNAAMLTKINELLDNPEELLAELQKRKRELERQQGTSPETQAAIAKADANVQVDPGHRLAVMSLSARSSDGKHQIRVLSQKQVDDGVGVAGLIGKGKPDSWAIGQVPEDIKSGYRDADLFTPKSTESSVVGVSEERIPNELQRALKPDELSGINILASTKDGSLSDVETGVVQTVQTMLNIKDADTINALQAYQAAVKLESAPWQSSGMQQDSIVAQLENLYSYLARVAPGGIDLPNKAKDQTIRDVEQIFWTHDSKTRSSLRRMIHALAGDQGPNVRKSSGSAYSPNPTGPTANKIRVDSAGKVAPSAITMAHELGHWAYFNILTPRDRLDFWKTARKFYDDNGSFDIESLKAKSIGKVDAVKDHHGDGAAAYSNEFDSPQELFANQFSMYVAQDARFGFENPELWRRVMHYIQGMYDRFLDKKRIDSDLEPLFAKIIPNETDAIKAASSKTIGKNEPFKRKVSQYIVHNYQELDMAQRMLRSSILSGNPDSIINDASEMVRLMMKITPSPTKSTEDAVVIPEGGKAVMPNAFGPLRGVQRKVRSKANQLANILRGANDDTTGSLVAHAADDSEIEAMGFNEYEWQPAEGADSVFNFENQEKIADEITAFVSDTNKKFGSLDQVMDEVNLTLTKKLRDFEGQDVFNKDLPEPMKEIGATLPPENPITKKYRTRAMNRRVRLAKEIEAKKAALSQANPGEKLKRSGTEMPSLKGRSMRQLVTLYDEHKGTGEGDDVLLEISRQANTTAPAENLPPISKDMKNFLRRSRVDELNAELKSALNEGRQKDATAVIWETQRRAHNKRVKLKGKAGEVKIAPLKSQESFVNRAIQQEFQDEVGGVTDGIPQSARLTVRETLGYFTHRNPVLQNSTRTMAYRMFNLMGKTARATAEEANVLSMDDVYRLSRVTEASPSAAGVMADFSSPEFKSLRSDLRRITVGLSKGKSSPFDLMHEVGHVLMRTDVITARDRTALMGGFEQANDSIKESVMRRKYGNLNDSQVRERRAEEWFVENWAQYLAERTAKGDVFAAREANSVEGLEMLSSLERILDRIIEAAAYMLNGLIGRQDIKQTFRRLTLFGDMLDRPELKNMRKNHTVASELAADVFNETLDSSTPRQRQSIDSFVAGGTVQPNGKPVPFFHGSPNIKRLKDGEVVFMPSDNGNYGPGIYITRDPMVSSEVFAKKPTGAAWQKLVKDSDIPEGKKAEAIELGNTLAEYRSRISAEKVNREDLKFEIAQNRTENSDAMNQHKADLERSDEIIEALEIMEASAFDDLLDMNVDYDPGVLPVYVKATAPFDATERSRYTPQSALAKSMVRWAHGVVKEHGGDDDIIDETLGVLADQFETKGYVSGDELYQRASDAITAVGLDRSVSRQMINRWLADGGFDSINSTHRNTVSGTRLPHETVTLLETPDNQGGWKSPSSRIKHQQAKFFDDSDDRLYYSEPTERSVNATLLDDMELYSDEDFVDKRVAYLLQNVEEKGTPKEVTNAAMKISKGRDLSEEDVLSMRRASRMTATLGSNSNRMREVGMNWIADFFDDYFPSTQNMFASSYMPIRNMLNKLPDRDGVVRAWAKRSNPFKVSTSQPQSHSNILGALRRGPKSRHYKQLNTNERRVADQIRTSMRELHTRMVRSGAMVGHIEDYMPQVWDTDAIKQNPEQFLSGIKSYLHLEDPMRSSEDADRVASHMMASIVNDDGVYVPPPVPSSEGVQDNLDFQRLIRTDLHKGSIDTLEPFMQNNLDYLLVKYMDAASKRIHQTEKMGTHVHAFQDYMDVGQHGSEAIVRLLSSPKVFSKKVKGQDKITGVVSDFSLERTMRMPFTNESDAHNGVTELIKQYGEHGTGAAREFLLGLLPEKAITPTYKHRVEAIVNAMQDFRIDAEGKPNRVHRNEFDHAEGTLRSIQGKQVNTRESEYAINASRGLRAFNNISLLSFTTLTSIPDIMLPLVRSGSFRDWARGLSRYALDSDYRQEIRNTGVAIENALHSRMVGMFGADVQGKIGVAQNAFFNATMLTPWTDMWRGVAGSVALESFRTQQRKAARAAIEGADITDQPRAVKFARRYMRRYGLDEYLDNPSKQFDPEDPAVAKAMIRFSNDTIFAPTSDDVPLWAQTPGGSILFQLKAFPLMMGRLSREIIVDAVKHGDFKRLLYLGAFAPSAGMAAIGVKDLIQMRGGDDGKSPEFRTRSAAKFFGFDESVHGNENDYLGWYIEGLVAAGGFGLIGEILHDVTSQADNGAYGQQRAAGALLGPSFGTGISAFNTFGGVKEVAMDSLDLGTSETNSKERQAVRELIGRTPMLGGIKAARETGVDFFAGEPEKAESRKKGWGAGYASGF